jgi:hypothetical protein
VIDHPVDFCGTYYRTKPYLCRVAPVHQMMMLLPQASAEEMRAGPGPLPCSAVLALQLRAAWTSDGWSGCR